MQERVQKLPELKISRYYASDGSIWENGTNQLAYRFAHPDKGSKFEQKFRILFHYFPQPAIDAIAQAALRSKFMKYLHNDALLFHDDAGRVYGHFAYEEKKDGSIHVYSIYREPRYKGMGLGEIITKGSINALREDSTVPMRVGAGNNKNMNQILEVLRKEQKSLEIIMREDKGDGWLDILPKNEPIS